MLDDSKRLTTEELSVHIGAKYIKLRPLAERYGVYREMDVFFQKNNRGSIEGVYVHADSEGYHYVFSSRGKETKNDVTVDLFEICFWVLYGETSLMAIEYASKQRVPVREQRRVIFDKQLEMLSEIGEDYRRRGEIELNEILVRAPL